MTLRESKTMSKLETLIQQLCPNGVEYKKIDEVAECLAGATPKTSIPAYWENGTIPWMSSGEVNNKVIYKTGAKITQKGYESCSTKMVPPNTVVVALAGQGKTRGTVAITRIELCTNQSLCSIITTSELLPDFLYHYLNGQYNKLRDISSGDGTRGGLNLKMIKNFWVPVPPLEVQREIVRILDNFTELTAELTTELTARKKQYEYYQTKLFSFGDATVYMPLAEIAEIGTGSSNTNEELAEGKYPFFVRSQDVRRKNEYEYDETAIITSGDGVGVGKIFHYIEGKYALHQRAYRIHITDERIIPKYFYYYMKATFLPYIEKASFHELHPIC